MTTTVEHTPANQSKLAQAQRAWAELLAEALVRGFFGTVGIELSLQDGTIQHIRRQVERLEK